MNDEICIDSSAFTHTGILHIHQGSSPFGKISDNPDQVFIDARSETDKLRDRCAHLEMRVTSLENQLAELLADKRPTNYLSYP